MPGPGVSAESLLDRRYRTLGRHSPLFYDTPIELVSGRGVWLRDADGVRYLDGYNNVPHVGHAHRAVADAVSRQMRKVALHTRYLNSGVIDYAEALLQTQSPGLDRVAFANSGSEANELAIRMARFRTQAEGLLVSDWSYHGTTVTLAGATTALPASEPLHANVRALRIPDATGLTDIEAADLLRRALADADDAIGSLQEAGYGVAALLIDPLFSTEGLVVPPEGYVDGLVSRVRRAGGLYISDEVQAGFGRTGSHMWGYERFASVPDIVTIGKPMGNGHPLGATVMQAQLLEDFGSENLFFNTFAGNPVSAAAGHAVLTVMGDEDLQVRAHAVGASMRSVLNGAFESNARVESVRGSGLFVGVRFADVEGEPAAVAAKRVVEGMKKRGVLISRIGRTDDVLKIRPPLVFTQRHADILLTHLLDTVQSL